MPTWNPLQLKWINQEKLINFIKLIKMKLIIIEIKLDKTIKILK
jgi:hypothetical protein